MDLLIAYESIKKEDEVLKVLADDKFFLSHACLIQEPNKESSWEFGFYNKESKKVLVFESNPFKKRQEDEVLKKEDSELNPVDLSNLKVSFDEVITLIDSDLMKKGITSVSKKIFILQSDKTLMWNTTIMTHTFDLLNMKINALTKEIMSTESYSIYDLGLQKA
ncbi:MAG: hypothetical protein ACMXX9_00170 [Candidatus Woesearchaeota archaeon]